MPIDYQTDFSVSASFTAIFPDWPLINGNAGASSGGEFYGSTVAGGTNACDIGAVTARMRARFVRKGGTQSSVQLQLGADSGTLDNAIRATALATSFSLRRGTTVLWSVDNDWSTVGTVRDLELIYEPGGSAQCILRDGDGNVIDQGQASSVAAYGTYARLRFFQACSSPPLCTLDSWLCQEVGLDPDPEPGGVGIWVRIGGVWRPSTAYAKVGGEWTPVEIAVRQDGTWRMS
jgi:hypothetical protein